MKGFLAGVAIVVIAFALYLRSNVSASAFIPGQIINQVPANHQNSSGAVSSVGSCNPTADHPGFRCIPRDHDGNVGQLGGVVPDENPRLPNRYFAYEGK